MFEGGHMKSESPAMSHRRPSQGFSPRSWSEMLTGMLMLDSATSTPRTEKSDAMASLASMKTGLLCSIDFGITESAFRADQQGDGCRALMAGQRTGIGMQNQFQIGFNSLLPFFQGNRCMDQWDRTATALFAGADGNLLPVLQTLL